MQVTMYGKRWKLRRVPNLVACGECDPPSFKNKEIRIRSTLQDELLLDTTIHELLHAACWPLDEDFVNRFATDAARVLWRLGYRKQENE